MKKILLLFIIGTLISCSQDEYENPELNNIEFEPYLSSFIEEGLLRGYDFSDRNINFYLADIGYKDAVGLCYYKDEKIIIDREYWNNVNKEYKEWLIFHELGHCFLNRSHRNEKSNSGECLSFMKGQENSFECFENLYSSIWRKYYIDELFNTVTVLPDWYTSNQEYTINYNNVLEIINITNLNTKSYDSIIDFKNKDKIVIEINFKDWKVISSNLNSVIADIYFGGYYFGVAPLSEKGRIHIRGQSREYFENNNYEFNKNVKLTIRKKNELFQFFIDEQFMHVMEIESFENDVLRASFNELINIDIKIFEYN